MKRLLANLLMGFILVFQGASMANELVDEVKQVRESNKSATVDISHIVKRYITVGARKIVVESFLKEHKFDINDQPISPGGSQTIVAIYVEKNILASFGFHDEIRVIVFFENEVVKSATGKLIYRAL